MEQAEAHGRYYITCLRNGSVLWVDTIDNLVVDGGKNYALDTYLTGSAYTVTGPFIGLISSVSYTTGPASTDTMASHPGWFEVSATTYFPTVAARLTPGWSAAAAGSKSFSSPVSFTIITNGGTLKGCFLVFGAGATSSLGSTTGVLYSAGTFSGGDKPVSPNDVIQISFTAAL